MSHPIYRALVTYSNTSTGEIRIKIPSLIGLDSEVSISYIGRAIKGTTWSVPDIGDQIVVTADDANLTNIFWLQVDEAQSVGGGVFTVAGERGAAIAAGTFFAFGNGAVNTGGVKIIDDVILDGIGFTTTGAITSNLVITIYVNGVSTGQSVTIPVGQTEGYIDGLDYAVSAYSRVSIAVTAGATNGGISTANAWFITNGAKGPMGPTGATGPAGTNGTNGTGIGDALVGSTNTFTTNQIIEGTTTASLLRITQLGTGNALLVEDSTNPDSTPVVIDGSGYVGIGTTTPYQPASYGALTVDGSSGSIYSGRVAGTETFRIQSTSVSTVINGIASLPLIFNTANTERMRIDSTGQVGIGVTPSAGRNLTLGKTLTGATSTFGVLNNSVVQSDVTTSAIYYRSGANTAAAAFTLPSLYHFQAAQVSFGAGSTVTTQIGFAVDSGLTGATNNYGFYADIASGTGRWNLYMGNTAANYMAGRLGVGAQNTSGAMAQVVNTTAADTVLVVKGAAGQTGDFLQLKDSAGVLNVFNVTSTGNLNVSTGASTGDAVIQVAANRTGNGYSYIDLIGDTTYSDYGLRLLRGNTGADTISQLIHRGLGSLSITTQDAAPLLFSTTNTERMRIDSAGLVGIGATPTASVRLTVTGGSTNSANPVVLINGVSGSGALYLHNDMGAGSYNSIVSAGSKGIIATGANSTTARASFVIAPWSDLTYGIRFEGGATTNILQHGTVILSPSAAANKALVVKGVASQTANLQEWQDSASAVKAFVSPTGAAQFLSIDGGTP